MPEKDRVEYKKQEQEAKTTIEFVDLAVQVGQNLQDSIWVKRLYEQAADQVKSISDLRKIARSIPEDIKNNDFEKEIYHRVLGRTRTKEEYIMYAQLMAFFLKDNEFSRALCENIEAIFLPKRTLEEAYKNFIDAIKDFSPQQKMEQFAGFLTKFKMNKHIKDIYYKAAKEFAQINKREALIAYLKYYQLSFREESKPEPVPERVVKSVFRNEKEHEAFLEVIDALKRDNDIGAALKKIDDRYRKKIELDNKKIAGIKSQHAGTVDKLGEILSDNDDEIKTQNRKEEKAGKKLTAAAKDTTVVEWSPVQKEFLALFTQNDFVLSKQETSDFARSKNQFESQLIAGINEIFLEVHDDMLIEEEEDRYAINPAYRKHPDL